MKVGDIILVSDMTTNKKIWAKRELVGWTSRGMFVCMENSGYLHTYSYGKPLKEELVYYYRWKMLRQGSIIISNYMDDKKSKDEGFNTHYDWTKIESSKTTYEELV